MRDGYVRRIAENALGALVSAVGIAMMLQANVGLEPWSVLQEGMSNTMGITYGTASILVGAVIIAVSLLCGEPIGLGTVLNIVLWMSDGFMRAQPPQALADLEAVNNEFLAYLELLRRQFYKEEYL